MLKNIKSNRINIDKKGKITTGIKVTNEKGTEYPQATDYFVIDDFPELKAIYGDKPKKLVLVFPTNDILDFFDANMVLYGSNNQMIRKCDGEESIHRIDEELDMDGRYDNEGNVEGSQPYKKKYVAGEISECCCKLMPRTIEKEGKTKKNPKLCNCAMYMKAFLVDYKTKKIVSPLCYHFYSGSENTASNIYSELTKIQTMMNGRIPGLPFGLSVDMVPGKTNAKIKYPIWTLQILGTMAQLEQAAESFLFDYREILQIGEEKKENTESPDQKKDPTSPTPDQLNNPDWFIDKMKETISNDQLESFITKYRIDLDFFDLKDRAKIEEFITEKKKEFKRVPKT